MRYIYDQSIDIKLLFLFLLCNLFLKYSASIFCHMKSCFLETLRPFITCFMHFCLNISSKYLLYMLFIKNIKKRKQVYPKTFLKISGLSLHCMNASIFHDVIFYGIYMNLYSFALLLVSRLKSQ